MIFILMRFALLSYSIISRLWHYLSADKTYYTIIMRLGNEMFSIRKKAVFYTYLIRKVQMEDRLVIGRRNENKASEKKDRRKNGAIVDLFSYMK
jgi:hypothetical protein